jgi:hypothetical protein
VSLHTSSSNIPKLIIDPGLGNNSSSTPIADKFATSNPNARQYDTTNQTSGQALKDKATEILTGHSSSTQGQGQGYNNTISGQDYNNTTSTGSYGSSQTTGQGYTGASSGQGYQGDAVSGQYAGSGVGNALTGESECSTRHD